MRKNQFASMPELSHKFNKKQQKYMSAKKPICQSLLLFRPIIFMPLQKINLKNMLELWIKIPCRK